MKFTREDRGFTLKFEVSNKLCLLIAFLAFVVIVKTVVATPTRVFVVISVILWFILDVDNDKSKKSEKSEEKASE